MATENDIVLIYMEATPLTFARIENITPDNKPDWYHVRLLFLQVPLQSVTWILKNNYINGETFTMDGKQMRLERVVCPNDPSSETDDKKSRKEPVKSSGTAQVISLKDLKKKH
ncbi:MAG: hypothetical protein JRE58_06505 [Deltaproteobacteria bacterium]|nr:hypothetical protein [Deltaproteobacteria bacterium]